MIKRLVAIFAVSMALSSCALSLKSSDEAGTGGEFLKGKVVAGFPAIPAYPKSSVLESYGFKDYWGLSSISDDSLEEVIKSYSASLKTAGWDYTVRQVSETHVVFDVKNAQSQGVVIVNTAADSKKTAITVSIEPR